MQISIGFFGNIQSNWREKYLLELKKYFSSIYSSNNSKDDINHLLYDDIIVLDLHNATNLDINTHSSIIHNLKSFRFGIVIKPPELILKKEKKENIFYIYDYELLHEIILCSHRIIKTKKYIDSLSPFDA